MCANRRWGQERPEILPRNGDQARQRRPPPSFCWQDGVTPARRFRTGCTRWILRRDSAPSHYEPVMKAVGLTRDVCLVPFGTEAVASRPDGCAEVIIIRGRSSSAILAASKGAERPERSPKGLKRQIAPLMTKLRPLYYLELACRYPAGGEAPCPTHESRTRQPEPARSIPGGSSGMGCRRGGATVSAARRGSASVVWSIPKIRSYHPHPPCPVNKSEGAVAAPSVHENRLVLVCFTAWRQ